MGLRQSPGHARFLLLPAGFETLSEAGAADCRAPDFPKSKDISLTRFEAVLGVVDRLRGLPMPEHLTLRTQVTARPPNADGSGYGEADIISADSIPVTFRADRGCLLSTAPVSLYFKTGVWPKAYLTLLAGDEPIAFGAIITADKVPVSGILEAAVTKLTIIQERRG